MLAGDLFLDLKGRVEIEVVEELQGFADSGRQVERVGVEGGLGGGGERGGEEQGGDYRRAETAGWERF